MAFPKLFIPRKNYLTGADEKQLPKHASADELANYLAIEHWANSLLSTAGGVLTVTATSDKSGNVSQTPANTFTNVGVGTTLSIAASPGDKVRAELSGTYFVSAGASGFLALMVDFSVAGVHFGGSLGSEYETPAALNTSYGFRCVGTHVVLVGDIVGGLVTVTPVFGHDVGTGTINLNNNANLNMISTVMNLSRASS